MKSFWGKTYKKKKHSGEMKEPTTTTATLEGDGGVGGGEGGGLVINTALSLASRLNQRADLLRRIFSFHKKKRRKNRCGKKVD